MSNPPEIRVLSLWQPWASLIGLKVFETRSWYTPYRGLVAIHAAKRPIKDEEVKAICQKLNFNQDAINKLNSALDPYSYGKEPLGCIIKLVNLTQCLEMVSNSGDPPSKVGRDTILIPSMDALELAVGDWQPGRFAWKCEHVKELEPISYRGSQGLTRLSDPSILEALGFIEHDQSRARDLDR